MVGEHKFYKLPENNLSDESSNSFLSLIFSGKMKTFYLPVSIGLFFFVSLGIILFIVMRGRSTNNVPILPNSSSMNPSVPNQNPSLPSKSEQTGNTSANNIPTIANKQTVKVGQSTSITLPGTRIRAMPSLPQGVHVIFTNRTISPPTNGTFNNSQSSQGSNQVIPTPTPVTQISITFQDSNGQTQTYTLPNNPPVQITWGRYTNALDHYSIDYPINWQVIKSIDNGHEGLSIFPPNATDTSQFAPHIGLGLSEYYSVPTTGTGQIYASNIIVDNLPGLLFTQGQEGDSYVASFFQYQGEYFGLGSSVTSSDLLYVFAHMIYSLTFSAQ